MSRPRFWRVNRAERLSVVVDAADYFRIARTAMMSAKKQILLIGWDFDAGIRLAYENEDEAPARVGEFLQWLTRRNPDLSIYILRWNVGAMKSLIRPRNLFAVVRWLRHRRIHGKMDGHHPPGASHHQKIVVIDDCLAFCGGIDMTLDRWDTREHLDDQPRRVDPGGKDYKPWHDATTAISGPVAADLGVLCRARWERAGGKPIAPPPATDACWPDELPVQFADVDVAISRTFPEMDDQDPVHEIEALYLDLIARARRFIYAESQYFASRRVAEAIARRLEEPDGPEVVIVNPVAAEGWLEPIAMDTARARLVAALRRRDPHGRFRIFHPVTAGGEPIYVHAKVTVIDDAVLRVGSSNFNNRSMRLDTECDVSIDADRPGAGSGEEIRAAILRIRDDLIAEHLDSDADTVARTIAEKESLIAAIDALRRDGRTLVDYEIPDLSETEKWLADNEVLDPETPEEVFEPINERDLLGRLGRFWS